MLKNFNLGTKLNLLLLLIFIAMIVISSLIFSYLLTKSTEKVVTDKALLLMESMLSVREYTSEEIRPELAYRLETEERFLAQTVPAYSARRVFENLRNRTDDYNQFFYKEATLNPTNLRDLADRFEVLLVERFQNQKNLKELEGFRRLPGGKIFFVARPLTVSRESCLRCHGQPEDAPRSQILTYGSDNGYGWQLNEVVGAQIVSVPATQVIRNARRLQFSVIAVLCGLLLIAVLILNFSLNAAVVNPLKRMAQLAKQVSMGNMAVEFKHQANDEIGILAASLNRLKVSLQMAMDMLGQSPGDHKPDS